MKGGMKTALEEVTMSKAFAIGTLAAMAATLGCGGVQPWADGGDRQVQGATSTAPGGASGWFQQQLGPTLNHLRAVAAVTPNIVVAVGELGTILRTLDGGVTWRLQPSGVTRHLYGVAFADERNGIAVGAQGTILHTINAGWTPEPSGTSEDLRGIAFIDLRTATAVGDGGTILRTTDGGVTWTLQPSGTTNRLFGVHFVDANIGTAVGDQGTILRTSDGGGSWIAQTSGTSQALYSVAFESGELWGDAAEKTERVFIDLWESYLKPAEA